MNSINLFTLICIEVKTISGNNPSASVPIIKGKKIKNSFLFKSKKFLQYWTFKFPYAPRFHNHKE